MVLPTSASSSSSSPSSPKTNRCVLFISLCLGVFLTFLTYALVEESIFNLRDSRGRKFASGWYLTMVQFGIDAVLYAVARATWRHVRRRRGRPPAAGTAVPMSTYVVLSVLIVGRLLHRLPSSPQTPNPVCVHAASASHSSHLTKPEVPHMAYVPLATALICPPSPIWPPLVIGSKGHQPALGSQGAACLSCLVRWSQGLPLMLWSSQASRVCPQCLGPNTHSLTLSAPPPCFLAPLPCTPRNVTHPLPPLTPPLDAFTGLYMYYALLSRSQRRWGSQTRLTRTSRTR